MHRLVGRFARDRRGVAAVMTALCGTALVASAATAVDLGDIFMRSRQLQGVADLAAMAAAQALGSSITTPQAAATQAAGLNSGRGAITANVVLGTYTPDPTLAAAQRFTVTASASAANAVQVNVHSTVPLYFAGLLIGRSSVDVGRSAVATRTQLAAFSIGSGLASLNGGVANAVLSALTGSQVSLSVMDYQALASAQVDLLSYMPALQTRAGLTAMSFDQTLQTAIAPPVALNALADTLSAEGDAAASAAARTLAAASTGLPATSLQTLFDLGPYAAQDHASVGGASVSVAALGLADALLASANGSRQLQLDLAGTVPGLAQVTAWLAIGQRPSHSPWLTVTDAGQVVVRTAQMRLYLQASVAPGALSAATGGALVTLPVYVEAASAQAKLQDISCPSDPASHGFDLSVSPSLGTLAIDQLDPSTLNAFQTPIALSPAVLVNALLIKATASARVDLGGGATSWQSVHFTQADIAAATVKSVYANDIAKASVASLVGQTTVGVQTPLGGLGLTPSAVSPLLVGILQQAAPPLDTLIGQIEGLTGVRLGAGDVWADGLRCNGAALVG